MHDLNWATKIVAMYAFGVHRVPKLQLWKARQILRASTKRLA